MQIAICELSIASLVVRFLKALQAFNLALFFCFGHLQFTISHLRFLYRPSPVALGPLLSILATALPPVTPRYINSLKLLDNSTEQRLSQVD